MSSDSQAAKKDWIKPTMASLYHGDLLVGTITNIIVEDKTHFSGDILLTDEAEPYTEMFIYFSDEERRKNPEVPDDEVLPFDDSLLEDWIIEDENGKRDIPHPVVTDGGEVFWRES